MSFSQIIHFKGRWRRFVIVDPRISKRERASRRNAGFVRHLEEIVAAERNKGDDESKEIDSRELSVKELNADNHKDDNLEVCNDGRVMRASNVHKDHPNEEIRESNPIHCQDDRNLCCA